MSCDRLCIFDTGYRLHFEDTVAGKRIPNFGNTCQHLSTFLDRNLYNTELLAAFRSFKQWPSSLFITPLNILTCFKPLQPYRSHWQIKDTMGKCSFNQGAFKTVHFSAKQCIYFIKKLTIVRTFHPKTTTR